MGYRSNIKGLTNDYLLYDLKNLDKLYRLKQKPEWSLNSLPLVESQMRVWVKIHNSQEHKSTPTQEGGHTGFVYIKYMNTAQHFWIKYFANCEPLLCCCLKLMSAEACALQPTWTQLVQSHCPMRPVQNSTSHKPLRTFYSCACLGPRSLVCLI